MSQTNFLIGRGELLTSDIKGPRRKPNKAEAYTLEQARTRLAAQFDEVVEHLDELPRSACPGDFGVARLTLNPSYIARSFFPTALLRATGLESLGSRNVKVKPESWTRKGVPTECSTTELFVAGKRQAFRALKEWALHVEPESEEAEDLAHIEQFGAFEPKQRVINPGSSKDRYFEFGIHLLPGEANDFVESEFVDFAEKHQVKVHEEYSFKAGNLWFVPVEGDQDSVLKLAEFVFVRVIRPMPKMRGLLPARRSAGLKVDCELPTQAPLSAEPRVAILDGGLPQENVIGQWVKKYRELDIMADDDPEALEHGLAVTSAFLFGPIEPASVAQRPYSYVDHLRVLDGAADEEHPLELYRTLGLVEEVLLSRQYEFINLSVGPDVAVEDTEVHAWTSVIDDLLSDGDTLMTVAVGNNGKSDSVLGLDRVQVPSDCVNALSVGAVDSLGNDWARAPYSAKGPGRSPGVVKPDLVAFGGDAPSYFHALAPDNKPALVPLLGTSFAAPFALRSAVGIRSVLGQDLKPLAIKALLVHSADSGEHEKAEVGWGRVPEDLQEIITCPPGVARVVYQGELKPGKYIRAKLPLPTDGLTGMVKLKATFCYACATDPQDASAYTRAGLEVAFRPNADKKKEGKANADTTSFFQAKAFATEEERRSDLGKWETVLHASKRMRGSSLDNPVFDIHYNARESGGKASAPEKIKYALIITIEAPKHADLYNDILRAYAKTLVPIQPQISLPLRA